MTSSQPATGRGEAMLRVEDLTVSYRVGRHRLMAVAGVSFEVLPGETLGIVGESGCGKSSVARSLIGLPPPSEGRVVLDGVELTALRGNELRRQRTNVQMVFQDPRSSLNPRRRVRDIVAEPLDIWRPRRADRRELVDDALHEVQLDPALFGDRYATELSGGQGQRVAIARALVLRPRVLVCDEPVSALDVSVQAKVLNLLEDLKERHELTMVFISHDLAVVKSVADRVLVMYLGVVCEVASTEAFFSRPAHPYSIGLLACVEDGTVESRREVPVGEPPSPLAPPSGCRYRTRCPRAEERCTIDVPVLRSVGDDHAVACHFPVDRP